MKTRRQGEGSRREGEEKRRRERERGRGGERGRGRGGERRKLVERHWLGQCPERPFPSIAVFLKTSLLLSNDRRMVCMCVCVFV